MPVTDVPLADLGPELLAVLLRGLVWVAAAAVVVGGTFWFFAGRDRAFPQRVHDLAFGVMDPAEGEPAGRRFLRVSFGLLWLVDGLLQAQPKMPAGFVAANLAPGVLSGPRWFGDLVGPLVRAWTRHPVVADAATVWIQVGLGLLMLLGGRGLLARIALWGSIVWSLVVWVIGEAFGGLLAAGASWLSGAPGAVLVYLLAAVLLLAPWGWWGSGGMAVIIRRAVAVWLVLTAVLQATPGEGFWKPAGLSSPFASGASLTQGEPFGLPISRLATVSANHPVAVNVTIIAMLVVVAVALWLSGRTAVVAAGIGLCLATWWLAQHFGVLGGTATDPNTSLPLALLLAGALPVWVDRRSMAHDTAPAARVDRFRRTRIGLGAGLATLALGLTVVVPSVLSSGLAGPADAAAVTADSGGGVQAVPHRAAVSFSLTDQNGRSVSMSSLRGKLIVLSFLDPVCTDDCPLIANQLAIANRKIGALARQVEFVAIDTNPIFHLQSDVQAFTRSHGLAGFTNWHFLWGQVDAVQTVLDGYGISVNVPAVGMIQHSEGVFFINADGLLAAYLDDAAGEQLTGTYADQVRDEIGRLVR